MNFNAFAAGAKPAAQNRSHRPWLMETVAASAVALSAGLAAIGVSGLIGWASPLAAAGSVALLAGTLLTETAASRLPVHAEARAREEGIGSKLKAAAAAGGFLVLTSWNLVGAHFGMIAIDEAGRADARKPLDVRLEAARSDEGAAIAAEAAARQMQSESAARWAEAMRAVPANYVGAGDRRQAKADKAAEEQAMKVAVAAAVTAKETAKRKAVEEAIAALPPARDDRELWFFTACLELLKGALLFFATGAERRSSRPISARLDAIAPAVRALLARCDDLAREEIDALGSLGGSISASVRHARARASAAA